MYKASANKTWDKDQEEIKDKNSEKQIVQFWKSILVGKGILVAW